MTKQQLILQVKERVWLFESVQADLSASSLRSLLPSIEALKEQPDLDSKTADIILSVCSKILGSMVLERVERFDLKAELETAIENYTNGQSAQQPDIDKIEEAAFNAARLGNDRISIALGGSFSMFKDFSDYKNKNR